jgi:diguanylate cyclase (GGDEF)-like protein/PAS domain S-box-containing protein
MSAAPAPSNQTAASLDADGAPPSSHRLLALQLAGGRGIALLAMVFLLACVLGYIVVRNAVSQTIELQALTVAEVVASQATTARSVYAHEIADKLTSDGFGPSVTSASMPGHVPIPAQFLKLVGQASTAQANRLYEYRPVSKWNLEPTQGLTDDFLRWAWPQLEAQDHRESRAPLAWKAIWRIEGQGAQRVLRYLSADPASQPSCVACHNAYERTPQIESRRIANGVPPGKHWSQHQLLGALSVTIPLNKAQLLAGAQINQTTVFIFGILVASFAAMFWFHSRLSRQDRDLRDKKSLLARSELEARSTAALLRANEGVEQAFAELSSYMKAVDQHAIVSVAGRDGRIEQLNDKLVTVSGYSREELVGQNHRILASGAHDRAFFSAMWETLGRGDSWRGVICNRAKSGELYWVDSAIVPLKDAQGDVTRYIAICVDITERMRAEQHIRQMATRDSLTGLVNRVVLRDRMEQALRSDRRTAHGAAVLFIDLDQFKAVNDSLGHEVGDQLLIEVSRRLVAAVREEDTVARQGGDEFIVFMPRIQHADNAAAVAEKLVRELSRAIDIGGRELYIGSSIGIAVFPDNGSDVETLLRNSDTAMYHVKSAGRNHYAFFEPQMHSLAAEHYALGLAMRKALEHDEFVLHYQPVVGVASGRVEGLEALLRWQHPERGLLSPMHFVPLAEASGLIVPIGEWVIRAACRQIRAWRAAGLEVPRVAVNLSALQVHKSDLVSRVTAIFAETQVEPHSVEFEITEGSLMNRTNEVVEGLRQLSALGVCIAIDDFGTGYSSLSYLKALPIDTLKVDRSFVKDIGKDADNAAIISTIVALGHGLGLKIIAEGVETPEQLAFLRALGCEQFQGYLASRPLPAPQVAALLQISGPLPLMALAEADL